MGGCGGDFQGPLLSFKLGSFGLVNNGWPLLVGKNEMSPQNAMYPLVLPCGRRCRGHFHVEDPLPRKREKPGGALEDITHVKIYTYRTYSMVLQIPDCILTWLA